MMGRGITTRTSYPCASHCRSQSLGITLVFVPGYDEMEVEPVVLPDFKPAGVEGFEKSQCIAFGCTGLDSLRIHAFSLPIFVIRTVYGNFHKRSWVRAE